jgi:hypothetical protein
VPGAIAATSAAIVSTNPAEAARAPAGPTNTTTGARDVIMRVESSNPPGGRKNNDDEIGTGGVGEIDDAGEILGRDRMDDAVQFSDRARSRWLHRTCNRV